MEKVKRNWLSIVLVGALILIVGAGLLVKYGMERAAAEEVLARFPDRGVPRMNITLNGASLEEINTGSKDTKYEGNEVTVYEGNEATLEASGVRLKGRGNTTWEQPKKPYQVKFNKKVDLFGMGENKKWILLANYFDVSLVRNDVAMSLAEMLDIKYNVRGKFIELYFDGEYEGLYYLLPNIEIAKGSVDLRNTNGLLFELDTLHRDEEDCHESYLGECLVLKDTVAGEQGVITAATERFMKDYNEFEIAVERGDYGRVEELVDVESFVKYFLISEFTVNPDAYVSSFYLYRDGENDKIHAGPAWDFDLALGNRNWSWQADEAFYSPYENMARKREVLSADGVNGESLISRILYYLEELPEFRDRIVALYREKMSGKEEELVSDIMNTKTMLNDVAKMNERKWEKEKHWGKSFEDEIQYLMMWIEMRYDFFEKEYGIREMTTKL